MNYLDLFDSVAYERNELDEKSPPRYADLEQRIKRMAARWQFSADELAETLLLAEADPGAWLRAVALDEKREAEFRERGLLPRTDA